MRIDHAAIRRALRNTVGDALRRSGDDVDVRVAPVDGQPVPLDEATGQ